MVTWILLAILIVLIVIAVLIWGFRKNFNRAIGEETRLGSYDLNKRDDK